MLILGPIVFQAFEVPETLAFGGAQSMAVHRLPGGTRVIDAMGRDDADLRWSGTFSGSFAADRARAIDLLRAEGAALALTWDAFFYTVVIARFDADYSRSTWIPYRITCTVLADEAAQSATLAISAAAMVVADVATAAGFDATLGGLASTLAVTGTAVAGAQAHSQAIATLAAGRATLAARIDESESAMRQPVDAASLSTLADTAGGLAASVTARAYLGRAAANFGNAST